MSVLIGLPCYGGISHVTGIGLFNLGKYLHARGIRHELMTVVNSSLISKCRSRIANLFLHATDFEYLLFIDSDIGFSVEDFAKLYEMNAEMSALPYPLKTIPPRYNFALTRREGRLIANSSGTAVQVDHIGTGFMLIRRSTFEKVAVRHPELRFRPETESSHRAFTEAELNNSVHFFETCIDPVSRMQLSEDLAFCRRARSAGVEIWMRLDTRLTHAGLHLFEGVDLQREFGALVRRD